MSRDDRAAIRDVRAALHAALPRTGGWHSAGAVLAQLSSPTTHNPQPRRQIMQTDTKDPTKTAEFLEEALQTDSTAMVRHAPAVSIVELSAQQPDRAMANIEVRSQALDTLRMRAIQMTYPSDWLLFKTNDGRVTAFLQDSGCERVRPLFSISIFDVDQNPRTITAADGTYAIVQRGRGRCAVTGDVLDFVEGVRESTEDFCKNLTGIKQLIRVQQAARATLDGKIVRELTGLSAIPLNVLELAWQGQPGKKTSDCSEGRGFGTKEQRHGGERAETPKLVPPICAVCGATGVFRTSARGGFYGCPDWKKHEASKWSVDLAVWEKDQRSKPQAAAPITHAIGRDAHAAAHEHADKLAGPQPVQPRPPVQPLEGPPLTDEDIPFGSDEPRGPRRRS